MKDIFVPYSGNEPAAVNINGHRLIILSSDKEGMEENLNLVGADRIKRMRRAANSREQDRALTKLAETIKGGVVVAPANLNVPDLIRNLETGLPWLQ